MVACPAKLVVACTSLLLPEQSYVPPPATASRHNVPSVQFVKSHFTSTFAIAAPEKSLMVTVKVPYESTPDPFLPTTLMTLVMLECAGSGTEAIAAPATTRPHTHRSVAFPTKPVIVAPPER